MTIISDAVSLILLAKISLLETFANRNKIVVPNLVYEEVIKGKEKGRWDSMLVERLAAEKKLIINISDKIKENKIRKLFNLKGGELEVISLAFDKHLVLTDDKKCLNAAKALNLGFITSLDVVMALYNKKAVTKRKALECINMLEEYGWYVKDLIRNYKEMIK